MNPNAPIANTTATTIAQRGVSTRDNRCMFVYIFRCNQIATQHRSRFKLRIPHTDTLKRRQTHGCIEEGFFEKVRTWRIEEELIPEIILQEVIVP